MYAFFIENLQYQRIIVGFYRETDLPVGESIAKTAGVFPQKLPIQNEIGCFLRSGCLD